MNEREVVREYYSLLTKLSSSGSLSDRKNACNNLIHHIQTNAVLRTDKFDHHVVEKLGKGFWEKTTERILEQLEQEMARPGKSGGALKELSNALFQLVNLYPGDADATKRPLNACGLSILKTCLRGIQCDPDFPVNNVVYESCAETFAKLAKRILKVQSIVSAEIMDTVFRSAVSHLTKPDNESDDDFYRRVSDDPKKVNYGEILRLVLRLMDYELYDDAEEQLFLVCTCWISSISEPISVHSDRRRPISATDSELMGAFADYLAANRRRCLPLLRASCGRTVISSIMKLFSDKSVVKQLSVVEVLGALGQCVSDGALHSGRDMFPREDLAWLQPNIILRNLEASKETALSIEIQAGYRRLLESASRTKALQSDPALSPFAASFAGCFADFVFWSEVCRKRDDPLEVMKWLTLNPELDSLRVSQQLVIVYHLISRHRLFRLRYDFSLLLETLIHMVSMKLGSLNKSVHAMQVYWALNCIAIVADVCQETALARSSLWADVWTVLTDQLLSVKKGHVQLQSSGVRVLCLAARYCPERKIIKSIEQLWTAGFFPLPTLDDKLAKFRSNQDFPLVAMSLVVGVLPGKRLDAVVQPLSAQTSVAAGDDSDDVVMPESMKKLLSMKANNLRCELIRWILEWSITKCDAFNQFRCLLESALTVLLHPNCVTICQEDDAKEGSLQERIQEMSLLQPVKLSSVTPEVDIAPPDAVMSSPAHEDALRWTVEVFQWALEVCMDRTFNDSVDHRASLQLATCAASLQFGDCPKLVASVVHSVLKDVSQRLNSPETALARCDLELVAAILQFERKATVPLYVLLTSHVIGDLHMGARKKLMECIPSLTRSESSVNASDSQRSSSLDKQVSPAASAQAQASQSDNPKSKKARRTLDDESEADSLFGTVSYNAPKSSPASATNDSQDFPMSSSTAAHSQGPLPASSSSAGSTSNAKLNHITPLYGKVDADLFAQIYAYTTWPSYSIAARPSLSVISSTAEALSFLSQSLGAELSIDVALALARAAIEICISQINAEPDAMLNAGMLLLVNRLMMVKHRRESRECVDYVYSAMEQLAMHCPDDPTDFEECSEGAQNWFILSKLFISLKSQRWQFRTQVKDGCRLHRGHHAGFVRTISLLAEKLAGVGQIRILCRQVLTHCFLETTTDSDVLEVIGAHMPTLMRITNDGVHDQIYCELCSHPGIVHVFRWIPQCAKCDKDHELLSGNINDNELLTPAVKIMREVKEGELARLHMVAICELAIASESRLWAVLRRLCLVTSFSKGVWQRAAIRTQFVKRLLSAVCARLNYASLKELLGVHSDCLWERFLSFHQTLSVAEKERAPGNALDSFPFEVFGLSSTKELLQLTLPSVIPAIFLCFDSNQVQMHLERVCKLLEPDNHGQMTFRIKTLLHQQRGNFYGFIGPLQYSMGVSAQAAATASKLFATLTSATQRHDFTGSEMTTAICRALSILCSDYDDRTVLFNFKSAAVTEFIANSHRETKEVAKALEVLNGVEILVHLSYMASIGGQSTRRSVVIAKLAGMVLEWYGVENVIRYRSGVLSAWVHLILKLLLRGIDRGDSGLVNDTLDRLHSVFQQANLMTQTESNSAVKDLALLVAEVIQSLTVSNVSLLPETKSRLTKLTALLSFSQQKAPKNLVESAKRLTEWVSPRSRTPGVFEMSAGFRLSVNPRLSEAQCTALLHQLKRSLDQDWPKLNQLFSVDEGTASEGALKAHVAGRTGTTWEILKWLEPTIPSMDPVASSSQVEALHASLTQDLRSFVKDHVPRVLASLLDLCGPDTSPSIRSLAADCLAKFRLCFRRLNSTRYLPSPDYLVVSSPCSQHDRDLITIKNLIVMWLHACSIHEDATVASCAVTALNAVLVADPSLLELTDLEQTKMVQQVKRELAHEWKDSLDTTVSSGEPVEGPIAEALRMARQKCSGKPVARPDTPVGSRPDTPLGSRPKATEQQRQTGADGLSVDLWQLDTDRTFAQWVSAVCDEICRSISITSDPVFKVLGPMCVLESRFAVAMFPWLVYQCVRFDNLTAIREFSERFTEVLSTEPVTQVHRLLVETISFLRGRKIAVHLVSGAPAGQQPLVTTRSAERKRAGGEKSPTPFANSYHGFWLSVDLKLVARVALHCEMPATAIMCMEILQDGKGAVANTTGAGMVDETTRTPDEELFLQAYRLLGDHDAMSGIPRTLDFRQHVLDKRLEGDWLASVLGYDQLMLQSWSTASNAGSSSQSTSLFLRGEATALARMGLVHASRSLLLLNNNNQEPLSSNNADPFLSTPEDLLYESMWRSVALGGSSELDLSNEMSLEEAVASNPSVHRVLAHGLHCLRTGDAVQLKSLCSLGRNRLLDKMQHVESLDTLTTTVSHLSILIDLENVFNSAWGDQASFKDLVTRWNGQDGVMDEETLVAREGMLRLGWRAASTKNNDSEGGFLPAGSITEHQALFSHLVRSCEFALAEGQGIKAAATLDRLVRLLPDAQPLPTLMRIKLALQKAMICWSDGDEETALRIGMQCARTDLFREEDFVGFQALRCLVGTWLANSSSAASRDVKEEWFSKAIGDLERNMEKSSTSAAKKKMSGRLLGEAHGEMASFLDRQFRSVAARVTSPEWKTIVDVQRQREQELLALQEQLKQFKAVPGQATRDEMKSLGKRIEILERECKMDKAERTALEGLHEDSLVLAVTHYLTSLHLGTSQWDQSVVFRVIDLWFNHRSSSTLNKLIRACFVDEPPLRWLIPSAKLVPLVYQIVSRISQPDDKEEFFQVILDLVKRLCREHPFHALPYVFALANSSNLPPNESVPTGNELKVSRAHDLLRFVSNSNDFLNKTVNGMRSLYQVFIQLAYIDPPALAGNLTIPNSSDLAQIPKNHLPLPVKTIPVRVNCDYESLRNSSELVRIAEIKRTYTVAPQGLSRPKILTLKGDDGKDVRILIKGKDDLRQDAVMIQLLSFVSELLARNDAASASSLSGKKGSSHGSNGGMNQGQMGRSSSGALSSPHSKQSRSMRIRTYNVLAMTPAAGLIEFVNDAISLGSYLYGSGVDASDFARSAHARFHPNDFVFTKCAQDLKSAAAADAEQGNKTAGSTGTVAHSVRLDTYRRIKQRFHPVFKHFFYERFGHDPMEWHERRDAYTRSTAANSMVGMILGIGDRHAQNIFIDIRTAELIHIDFGITFEQGKALRTPETVPFRLTPDIVDGFGVSGVQGVFTRACEDTLAVLRDNAEAILTICEVFVHDPLHKWNVNPFKQRRIENRGDDVLDDAQQNNKDEAQTTVSKMPSLEAERVLSRLRQKLQGHVEDGGEPLSVAAQVKRVIQEATDEVNLCMLYCGWAPFL